MSKHILFALFLHIIIGIMLISCKFYLVKNKNKLFYITSIEKQNTVNNNNNLKNIKLIKKKKQQFILLKKNKNIIINLNSFFKKNERNTDYSSFLYTYNRNSENFIDTSSYSTRDKYSDNDVHYDDTTNREFINKERKEIFNSINSGYHDNGNHITTQYQFNKRLKKNREKNGSKKNVLALKYSIKDENGIYDEKKESEGKNSTSIDKESNTKTEEEEYMNKFINDYMKRNENILNDNDDLKKLDKEKMLEEYNRLVETLKKSNETIINKYKENEKENKYELNERIINSSNKINIEKIKKDIETSFTQNLGIEHKIQNYINLFTQQEVGQQNDMDDNLKNNKNNENMKIDNKETEFITENEEEENKKILKTILKGDYKDLKKFNFKFSKKDLEMMKNVDQENANMEEKELIEKLFFKIINNSNVINSINKKEEQLIQVYDTLKKENKIKRDENIENIKYYNNKKIDKEKTEKDHNQTIIPKEILFNKVSNKFVEISEEEINEMSEVQTKEELKKRGYPTFGTMKEIKMRLLDVMKIKENHEYDVRKIVKNPEENLLSNIKYDKLKKNIKIYKEMENYGDTESKLKKIDSAIEISKFIDDPVDYLRIDTTHKFVKLKEEINEDNTTIKNEDISKIPIINDVNIDEEISMAEKLKKNIILDNVDKAPSFVKYSNQNENMNEEIEETYRTNILKHGSLQETIEEFHIKHNLCLNFIGDFICKFSNAHIQDINKYRYKTKEEIDNLKNNEFEYLINESTLNCDFIVYKFVNKNDLIKNYLTTKNIMTLIEYANISDPVDIIHYYSPETLFMISEEYNIPINKIIDACTSLNIKLPYGGDTHLNKKCFNILTTHLSRKWGP
ncbi:conserved Plasmodium protein, unknown function [Plasmodium berghei]|uniref:SAP domain-containing protein n=2 Tax=Plasmodium berghei TaxID=5821 RepID=A0A509ASH2_PLABA|nr:conserved Plasmodium protein, unknown function [Plasmodium berghei ANKA]CXJ23857.1 conserved Plasmodium protein, unknown function [Plasmodium berghei]SCM26759.1 conserved Plasmodium protein, unknown function [Plasmodium berghei]SCN28622.1 conserved Plasmodium protein, unknown function [Plasmodium berghei]SCO62820.1 conserved Plasmodium protein, unknown function [Plasmodium berghei]SCO64370.1 conserved Plasmodium protein, unknown function [Plasmodium berghei]|eukprot:XP_034424266.1 conserved Plasmodium protein, unknown function [Plasmodium berghei ANKA]